MVTDKYEHRERNMLETQFDIDHAFLTTNDEQ